jgi:hypothetical protein
MGYCGAVPSEDSSGKRTRRGGITKTGNAHLRRIVVEAAWSYRRPPCIWYRLRWRQESISEEAKQIAWKAQHRLHKRDRKLGAAGCDRSGWSCALLVALDPQGKGRQSKLFAPNFHRNNSIPEAAGGKLEGADRQFFQSISPE